MEPAEGWSWFSVTQNAHIESSYRSERVVQRRAGRTRNNEPTAISDICNSQNLAKQINMNNNKNKENVLKNETLTPPRNYWIKRAQWKPAQHQISKISTIWKTQHQHTKKKPQNPSLPSLAGGVSVRGQPRYYVGECSLGVGGVFIFSGLIKTCDVLQKKLLPPRLLKRGLPLYEYDPEQVQ